MKMSITISVTFLNTLCNLINKFDKTQTNHFSREEKNKTINETKLSWSLVPSCPPPAVGSNLYLFFQRVEEEMKINDKIQTQTIKQNERPPTN